MTITANRRDVETKAQDSKDLDALGRLRIAESKSVFDSQFQYNKQPLFWNESVSGNGTVTLIADKSSIRLSTGGTASGDKATFQTKSHFRYQAGKCEFIIFTALFGDFETNVRKRIGMFDDDNGLFFEQSGGVMSVVRRTSTSGSPVDVVEFQTAWNLDVMTAGAVLNPSGVTYSPEQNNVYVIDFQWLGGGRIRFGIEVGGETSYFHEVVISNSEPTPWATTANLPFRVEIENTGTASASTDFDFTCVSVASEAGYDPTGVQMSLGNQETLRTVSTTPFPLFSIRPKTTFETLTNRIGVALKSFNLFSLDEPVYYEFILNGSLTGASFSDVDTTNSSVEFDESATSISGGTVIDSGYISGAKDKAAGGTIGLELMSDFLLTNDIAGTTTDVLSIVCRRTGIKDSSCGVSFTWKELY